MILEGKKNSLHPCHYHTDEKFANMRSHDQKSRSGLLKIKVQASNGYVIYLDSRWKINKVTCHAVWTPALSLGVFITRKISENILSFSVRHSLTEFIISMHIYFFVMGHRLDGANVKMDK